MDKNKKNSKTVLIVEDHPALAQALIEKLTSEDFNVLKAVDGEEGLALAFKHHPDLILLDIIMPKVDGFSFLKQLRQDDWGKDVPVVVLSNVKFFGEDIESLKSSVSAYLVKTKTSLEDIVNKVKEVLSGVPA